MQQPARWGLPQEAVESLAQRLQGFWEQFRPCFRTTTRDSSRHALDYLSAQLRLESERNFTNIGRATQTSPQAVQHFMSNSPWSAQHVMRQVQAQIAATPALRQGGILLLDESAEQKASTKSVGATRQYNGRLGKVEMSQVGTFLAFAHLPTNLWTWVDGELFLPQAWFNPERCQARKQLGVPPERGFATKVELGWQMIQRVKQNGLPFEALACDELYGRKNEFRSQMHQAGILYMADVPKSTPVSLSGPEGLTAALVPVSQIAAAPSCAWQVVRVRATERGFLEDRFAALRVWTRREETPTEEWLVIRQFRDGSYSYALSNASPDTPLSRLAWLKCVRHFIECANQDAKSEAGWDDLRAQKYRAWEHHLALTVLATWFVAQTKLEWAQSYPGDPALSEQLQVDRLPSLSMSNVRTLLRAAMPLPQLSSQEAASLVAKHLFNWTQARKSRLKKAGRPPT